MPNKIWNIDNIGLTIDEIQYHICTLDKDEKIDIHNVSMESLLFMLKALDLYNKVSTELSGLKHLMTLLIENSHRKAETF